MDGMIDAPMTCLTLNRLQHMMVRRKKSIQTISFVVVFLIKTAIFSSSGCVKEESTQRCHYLGKRNAYCFIAFSISVCLSVYICLLNCFSTNISRSLSLFLIYFSVCVRGHLFVPLSVNVSISIYNFLSTFHCISLSMLLAFSVSLSPFISLSFFLSLSVVRPF